MPKYIALATYTEQGRRNIKETVGRVEALTEMARMAGIVLEQIYWTRGSYDFIAVVEAPNDERLAAMSLSAERLGNVRMQIVRAFDAEEMKRIVNRLV